MTNKITFTLDSSEVTANADETIWQVAKREGTRIPHLCHLDEPGYRSDGNCRACMVEVEGERVLAASCQRKVSDGMVVRTDTERADKSRRMVFELLASDMPAQNEGPDNQSPFWQWAKSFGIDGSGRLPSKYLQQDIPLPNGERVDGAQHRSGEGEKDDQQPPHPTSTNGSALQNQVSVSLSPAGRGKELHHDISNPAIAVNLDSCIACGLCVRACREVQVNDVLGMGGRGGDCRPVFDFADAMGNSTCVTCGECVQACPTGALFEKSLMDADAKTRVVQDFDREIDSVCPFCGVGCQTIVRVKDNKIMQVDGRDGPANENRLCVKGRFGFDYAMSAERLTKPLIRRDDAPKDAAVDMRNRDIMEVFREATWEEALAKAAGGLKKNS